MLSPCLAVGGSALESSTERSVAWWGGRSAARSGCEASKGTVGRGARGTCSCVPANLMGEGPGGGGGNGREMLPITNALILYCAGAYLLVLFVLGPLFCCCLCVGDWDWVCPRGASAYPFNDAAG